MPAQGMSTPPRKYLKPKVIAEIGCNHKGEMKIAKELLQIAKECGCTYGTFQKRCNRELLSKQQHEVAATRAVCT